MKLLKILKNTVTVASIFAALFAISCSNGNSSSETGGKGGLANAAPGSVVKIDGKDMIVLKNTYYTPSRSARAAGAEGNKTQEFNNLDEAMQQLASKYQSLNIAEMLNKINVTDYVKVMAKKIEEMPYQRGGTIYLQDYIYFYNTDGKKIAYFQMNWESAPFLAATNPDTYNRNNYKSVAAVNDFANQMGFKKILDSTETRYTYTEADYKENGENLLKQFRTNYDPEHYKVGNYPENLSDKRYLTYGFKLNENGQVEELSDEAADTIYMQWDYQEVLFNGNKKTFASHKTNQSGKLEYFLCDLDSYNFYACDCGDGSYVIIRADGTGEVGADVDQNIFRKISISYDEKNYVKFKREINGGNTVEISYNKKEPGKTFYQQPVTVKVNNVIDPSMVILGQALVYLMPEEILYEDFVVTEDKFLPDTLTARALFPKADGRNHNKDYTKVELTLNGNNRYQLKKTDTIAATGESVPAFVKKYSDVLKTVFSDAGYSVK